MSRLLPIMENRGILKIVERFGSCVAARGGAKNKCFLTAELIRVRKSGWKRKNRGEQRREGTRWENSTLYSNI